MEQITEFIGTLFMGEGIIIAVGAFVLGMLLKHAVPNPSINKYIPLVCGAFGIVVALVTPTIFPTDAVMVAAIKGLALAWAATGGFETVKNLKAIK